MATRKKAITQSQKKNRVAKPALAKGSQKLFSRQGAMIVMGAVTIIGLIAVVSTFAATNGNSQRPQSNIKCVRDTTGKCHRYWMRPKWCPVYGSPKIITLGVFGGAKAWNMNTWDTRRAVCKKKYVRYSPGKPNAGGAVR